MPEPLMKESPVPSKVPCLPRVVAVALVAVIAIVALVLS